MHRPAGAQWEFNEASMGIVQKRLRLIGEAKLVDELRLHKNQTGNLETHFGHTEIQSSDHDRTQTVQTMGKLSEGMRLESWKGHIAIEDLEYNHTLTTRGLYQEAKKVVGGVTEADLKSAMTSTKSIRRGRSAAVRHAQYLQAKARKKTGIEVNTNYRKRKREEAEAEKRKPEMDALHRVARLLRAQPSQRLRDRVKKPANFTVTTLFGVEIAIADQDRQSVQCENCRKWRFVDDLGEWTDTAFECSSVGNQCEEACDECEAVDCLGDDCPDGRETRDREKT